jgi:hypothetical protein
MKPTPLLIVGVLLFVLISAHQAGPVDAATVIRIEETSSAVRYVRNWTQDNFDRAWSGGTAATSSRTNARATLTFTGTGVSWIGFRGPQAGIARVYRDGALVSTIDAFAPQEEVGAILYATTGLTDATHTLTIEVTGTQNPAGDGTGLVAVDAFDVTTETPPPPPPPPSGTTFAPGDVLVSIETGPVQWRHPNGTLQKVLTPGVAGTGEGMDFDPAGNLYVSRWCSDNSCLNGNTVEKFDSSGQSLGRFGSGYDCAPHTIVFDAGGIAYVGQAACTNDVLKFVPGQAPVAFNTATENYGTFWMDLAPDSCTLFYTSWGPNVKRFDVCAGRQLSNFNTAALPGGEAQDLKVLPDGGVLVSSGEVIARLDRNGALIRTYGAPENALWAGLDLVGDGTFWVANYYTSNVYRFDLATGAVWASFNTGTPSLTAVGVSVKK